MKIIQFVCKLKELDTMKKTIEALTEVGAKQNKNIADLCGWKNDEGKARVLELRSYLKTIDGFKNIIIYESSVNKGLANSIIEGVTKVLNTFDKAIVIEDDLITSPNFLNYMNQVLTIYENREDIISVSGHSLKFKLPDNYDSDSYTSDFRFYTSKDGTQVPIHISYKKSLEINENTPVLLYGYGGFNISRLPQENQLGTGDAVKSGLIGHDLSEVNNVLVVFGDTPLLTKETLENRF